MLKSLSISTSSNHTWNPAPFLVIAWMSYPAVHKLTD